MNLSELKSTFRREIKDTARPYLVSDEDADAYANEAVDEAARRARLIVDSVTPNVAVIPVSANDPLVKIHPSVVSFRRIRLGGSSIPLIKKTVREMDQELPGWEESTSTTRPYIIVIDYDSAHFRLHPKPAVSGQLYSTVTRTPVDPMKEDEDEPELNTRYHRKLIHWMKWRAYSNEDSDLFDEKRAERELDLFEIEFGPPSSAINERWEFEHYDDIGER